MASRVDRAQDVVTSSPYEDGRVSAAPGGTAADEEKALPLPGWLVKLYFIFPIILYIPDAIFNYFVYSDGVGVAQDDNPVLAVGKVTLWAFMSIGIVGMAYLLSVLAPWHWVQGHRIQAFFCGVGVVIATGITTWNSLAFRSTNFAAFATDRWAYGIWPQLEAQHISLTMIIAAIAPPFWGLFWAIVQPTQTKKSLAHLQEGHAERMLRMQQEAEIKRLKAETAATVREAQLKGMAQTAAAARQQAAHVASQWRNGKKQQGGKDGKDGASERGESAGRPAIAPVAGSPSNVLQMPTLNARPREQGGGRSVMMNSAAAVTPATHTAPASGRAVPAQPPLLREADVQGTAGVPVGDAANWGSRRQQTLGMSADVAELDGFTGTTGPRPAVRRAAEPSPLLRAMNELPQQYVRAVEEARAELNPNGSKRSIPAKDLAALVARKLNVDDATATKIISRVREAQRATARS